MMLSCITSHRCWISNANDINIFRLLSCWVVRSSWLCVCVRSCEWNSRLVWSISTVWSTELIYVWMCTQNVYPRYFLYSSLTRAHSHTHSLSLSLLFIDYIFCVCVCCSVPAKINKTRQAIYYPFRSIRLYIGEKWLRNVNYKSNQY